MKCVQYHLVWSTWYSWRVDTTSRNEVIQLLCRTWRSCTSVARIRCTSTACSSDLKVDSSYIPVCDLFPQGYLVDFPPLIEEASHLHRPRSKLSIHIEHSQCSNRLACPNLLSIKREVLWTFYVTLYPRRYVYGPVSYPSCTKQVSKNGLQAFPGLLKFYYQL